MFSAWFDCLIAHVLFVSVVCWCRRTIKSINWPFTFEFINIDPRTNDWPLISSPVPGLTILGAYLYFILSWGPRYMANRKPHKLENVLIAYNLIQVIVSTYIFYEVNLLLVLSNREWEKKSCYNNAFKDRVSPDLVFTFGGCFVFVFHSAETVTYKMYSMYQLCIRKVSRSINSFFLLICWFFFCIFHGFRARFTDGSHIIIGDVNQSIPQLDRMGFGYVYTVHLSMVLFMHIAWNVFRKWIQKRQR